MRYFILACVFVISVNTARAQSYSVSQIRNMYLKAVKDKPTCDHLLSVLKGSNERNPLMWGFQGATLIVSALHCKMPWDKLSAYNKGKKTLEKALAVAPEDIELRYLRLGIQSNLPRYLDYRSDITRDSTFLRKELSGIEDRELRLNINAYLRTLSKRKS